MNDAGMYRGYHLYKVVVKRAIAFLQLAKWRWHSGGGSAAVQWGSCSRVQLLHGEWLCPKLLAFPQNSAVVPGTATQCCRILPFRL